MPSSPTTPVYGRRICALCGAPVPVNTVLIREWIFDGSGHRWAYYCSDDCLSKALGIRMRRAYDRDPATKIRSILSKAKGIGSYTGVPTLGMPKISLRRFELIDTSQEV